MKMEIATESPQFQWCYLFTFHFLGSDLYSITVERICVQKTFVMLSDNCSEELRRALETSRFSFVDSFSRRRRERIDRGSLCASLLISQRCGQKRILQAASDFLPQSKATAEGGMEQERQKLPFDVPLFNLYSNPQNSRQKPNNNARLDVIRPRLLPQLPMNRRSVLKHSLAENQLMPV